MSKGSLKWKPALVDTLHEYDHVAEQFGPILMQGYSRQGPVYAFQKENSDRNILLKIMNTGSYCKQLKLSSSIFTKTRLKLDSKLRNPLLGCTSLYVYF